jgi:hypothetical protein
MSIRSPDEIVSIHVIVKPPAHEPFEKKFSRVGHIFILQIGSGENCQIRDACLANFHTSIEVQMLAAYVTNIDNVVGTLINGQRLHGRITLRDGDEIRCGDLVIDIKFGYPMLDGENSAGKPSGKCCPKCREFWERRPSSCTSRPHWITHVNHLNNERGQLKGKAVKAERERVRLNDRIDEIEKECMRLNRILSEKCNGCGEIEKLSYCKTCIENRDAAIERLDEAYKDAFSRINRGPSEGEENDSPE